MPPSSAAAPSAVLARAQLDPPGFLAAAAPRLAELPLVLTERMAHGEAAPSSEFLREGHRSNSEKHTEKKSSK